MRSLHAVAAAVLLVLCACTAPPVLAMTVTETELGPFVTPDRASGWFVASPDAAHLLQCVTERAGARVYLDGRPVGAYDDAGLADFSPDGTRFAFAAVRDKQSFVVTDGREIPTSAPARAVRFTPTTGQLTWIAPSDGTPALVVEGEPVATWPFLSEADGDVALTPRDGALAFRARRDDTNLLVLWNGGIQELPAPSGPVACWLSPTGPVLRPVPEGRGCFGSTGRLAYADVRDGRFRVVCDGKPGPWYSWVCYADELIGANMLSHWRGLGAPTFSPDGGRLAYQARRMDPQGRAQYLVVWDGAEGPAADLTGPPLFSPDSQRLAYVAVTDRDNAVWVDGWPGPPYPCVVAPSLCWDADSTQVAYVARGAEGWRVIVREEEGPAYPSSDRLGSLGNPVLGYPRFLPDGSVQYLVERDGTIYRVRLTVGQ
jgi:hypothetical protein